MISRCPSCAAQVDDDASRCPSCHWDFIAFKHIPPAGEAVNPTIAAKGAPAAPPPQLPTAKALPTPPTTDPSVLPKARAKAELPGDPSAPALPPMASNFSIPTFKNSVAPPAPLGTPAGTPTPRDVEALESKLNKHELKMTPFSEDTESATSALPKERPADKEKLKEREKEREREREKELEKERERERARARERDEEREKAREAVAEREKHRALPPDADIVPQTAVVKRREPPTSPPKTSPKTNPNLPEKLRRRSPTDGQPAKEIKKHVAGADPIALMAIVALIVAAGAVVVVKFTLKSDVEVGSRPARPASVFTGSSGVTATGVTAPAPAMPASAPAPAPDPAPAPVSAAAAPAQIARVALDPMHPEHGPVAVPAGVVPVPAVAPTPSTATSVAPKPPPTPPDPIVRTLPPPEPRKPPPEAWVFEGEVFDGQSLRPVAFTQIAFSSPDGKVAVEAVTRENGRYRVSLPPLPDGGGYSAALKHADYQPKFIEDVEPSLKTLTEDDRLAILRVTAIQRPWKGNVKAATRKNLVAVPSLIP